MGFDEVEEFGLTKTLFFAPNIEPIRQQELFCLRLKRVQGVERGPGMFREPCTPESRMTVTDFGIVLTPPDSSKTRFQRIGYFHEFVHNELDGPPSYSDLGPPSAGSESQTQDRKVFVFDYLRLDLEPHHQGQNRRLNTDGEKTWNWSTKTLFTIT